MEFSYQIEFHFDNCQTAAFMLGFFKQTIVFMSQEVHLLFLDGLHVYHRELLGHLSDEQFEKLERALCSAEGLGTLNRNKKDNKPKVGAAAAASSKKTESLSGEEDCSTSTSTPYSEPPMPSANSPECVFEPRPPQSSRDGK